MAIPEGSIVVLVVRTADEASSMKCLHESRLIRSVVDREPHRSDHRADGVLSKQCPFHWYYLSDEYLATAHYSSGCRPRARPHFGTPRGMSSIATLARLAPVQVKENGSNLPVCLDVYQHYRDFLICLSAFLGCFNLCPTLSLCGCDACSCLC